MLKTSPRLLLVLLALAAAPAMRAAEPTPPSLFPPISGEFAGDLLPWLPGMPKLHWRVAVAAPRDGVRTGTASVTAPGLQLDLSVRLGANLTDGTWRIETGRVEPGPWLAALAPQLAPTLIGAEVSGVILLSGEGTLRGGQPFGRVKIEWRDGAVRQAAQKLALEGIAFSGEFDFDGAKQTWASVSPAVLKVGTIATGRFGARNLLIHLRLDQRLVPAVDVARVEIAGGELEAAPFVLPLTPPAINVKLKISRIGLQDVVALVPAGVSEARGRVDGELALGWSKALGLQIGSGRLDLRPDEPMVLRLIAAPGLLSANMPERFEFLPSWLGPLAKWASPLNPGFADLVAIELGRTALAVDSLEVRLTPEGDRLGRSARVLVNARPEIAGTSVGPVTFEVGVKGPLAYVLRIGAENGAILKLK